jgi:phosphoenolpyruvate---glycerone phosphotransferase subunit DhaL
MNKLNCDDIKKLFDVIGSIMRDKKEYLCEIDAQIGDGDLGLTMSKGFTKAAEGIADTDINDIGKLLVKAGMVIAQSAPSTMGTLMASGFMAGGKSLVGKDEIGTEEFILFLDSFVNSLMKRGKSAPGEKTIIDALYPAAQNAKQSSCLSLEKCASAAEKGAKEGLKATGDMMSQHGKAAVFREKTIGIQDPGAFVGWILIKAFSDYIEK